ncbi:hypothetical protein PFRI_12560 [Planktotalea frisia]|uniref:Uncharacterized protein n=1 Tax=Planktotalea frisia TaxID=696762 RepID=A0A1L9NZL2_9RHOB|nr:hypothetical protein PFRI_12560 [Planktotalea frisia]
MRPKSLQDIIQRLEVTGLNGCLVVIPILNEDRQNYRTLLLDLSVTNLPNGTTNSLNDLYLTAFWVNESNTIKRRYINTFSQASCIG